MTIGQNRGWDRPVTPRKRRSLSQFQQLDVFVPDLVAEVLKTQETLTSKVFDGSRFLIQFVFVLFAVGADSGFREFIRIDFADFRTVERHGDLWPLTANFKAVPFAGLVPGIL